MTIYSLIPDYNDYKSFDVIEDIDGEEEHNSYTQIMNIFNAKSIKESWIPVKIESYFGNKGEEKLGISDCPNSAVGTLLLSQYAVQILNDLLESHGEILETICEEGKYYYYNITTVLDAFNLSNSEYELGQNDHHFRNFFKFVFFPDMIRGTPIFKIPQHTGYIFVNEIFVERVRSNNLTGFWFKKVWEGD